MAAALFFTLSRWNQPDDLLVIHALVAGRGHVAAERAVDVPEPVAVEEQGAHAGVDLRCLAAKLQHGAPVVPLAAHGGGCGCDVGLRRRVAVADVVIIGVGAAVRPEGGILGRVAHGHALGREGEPRVAEIARQRRLALVVLQIPGGVEVIDRAVELRRFKVAVVDAEECRYVDDDIRPLPGEQRHQHQREHGRFA